LKEINLEISDSFKTSALGNEETAFELTFSGMLRIVFMPFSILLILLVGYITLT
jgi:hypothetical protein